MPEADASLSIHFDVEMPGLAELAARLADYDADGRYCCYVEHHPEVQAVAVQLESLFGCGFPIVAFQAYRDGHAVTPWHDDRTLTGESAIASFGAARMFLVRPIDSPDDVFKVIAPHGSVIHMPERFQTVYEHRIGPEPWVTEPRWSFVFRTFPPNPNPMRK